MIVGSLEHHMHTEHSARRSAVPVARVTLPASRPPLGHLVLLHLLLQLPGALLPAGALHHLGLGPAGPAAAHVAAHARQLLLPCWRQAVEALGV